jgi:Protein of unknown function (DUF1153)
MAEPSADPIDHPRLPEAADLPPAQISRWSPQRKALVVNAVHNGTITREEASCRYCLSAEELIAWEQAIATHGIRALRVTRLQLYRAAPAGVPKA